MKILLHHIMIHHIVAAAEGGRHYVVRGGRRPPLIMWCGSIFSIGLRIFSCNWPQLVSFLHGFIFVNIPGLPRADFLSVLDNNH